MKEWVCVGGWRGEGCGCCRGCDVVRVRLSSDYCLSLMMHYYTL